MADIAVTLKDGKRDKAGKQDPAKLPTCPQCSKTFFRKAHMLRHVQQHTGNRPYSCQFCSKTFKRSDVLRDHFNRCEHRNGKPIPAQEERGRKRHACDHCARLKIKCDSESPCQKCKEFNRACVRSRTGPKSTDDAAEMTNSDRSSISFLLNCPEETEFMHRFPESSNTDKAGSSGTGSDYLSYSETGSYDPVPDDANRKPAISTVYDGYFVGGQLPLDTFLSDLPNPFAPPADWRLEDIALDQTLISALPPPQFSASAELEARAVDIREKLCRSAECLFLPENPPPDLLQAIQLITGLNLDTFVKLYFHHWHKHGPMVHEPSFDPIRAPIPLLLSMFSVGGMYSSHKHEVAQVKRLLDLVEFQIYSTAPFNDDYQGQDNSHPFPYERSFEWQQYRLLEIQGGHLMIVAQYWTGNPQARKRARRQRFSKLVDVAREFFATLPSSSPYVQDEATFRSWIFRESHFRTLHIMMLLDNAFVIFNNSPTRMEWSEIGSLELPCEAHYFEAATIEDLYASPRLPLSKFKVRDAVQMLFQPEVRKVDLAGIKNGSLNALDLQIMIHHLYTHIWRQTYGSMTTRLGHFSAIPNPNATPMTGVSPASQVSVETTVAPLKTALVNWKIYWDEVCACTPQNVWSGLGFEKAAENYWALTKAVLVSFERRGGKDGGGLLLPVPCDTDESGLHIKRLLS